MNNFKKSFTLLITLFLISLFSFISIFIIELSNISTNLDTRNLLYSQANLHMKSTINSLSNIDIYDESKECIDTMSIDDEFFHINLYFSYITKRIDCTNILSNDFDKNTTKGMTIIDIYINPKDSTYNIKLHKRIVKKLE